MKMGLREANQNFSKAIKAIKAGKAIVLTERGRPIAKITPIVGGSSERDDLQPLRDEGFLIGRQKSGPLRTKAKPQQITGPSISRVLRQERDAD